jgi:hypothetical protein
MKTTFLFTLILSFCLTTFIYAQGDLLITPTRVVFEGNKQKEELNLVNVGNDTAIYAASFVQYRMTADGGFVQIETPDSGQMFADPYLRLFPRRVTLAPREPQVIMLQLRRKPDMKDGEYRSHLYFRAEKDNAPLGTEQKGQDTTTLNVQLIPVFGLSIPVIIRTGKVSAQAGISDMRFFYEQDTIPNLAFDLIRTGNISIYGDIKVDFTPEWGPGYDMAMVKGVGVYTNLNRRHVIVRLTRNAAIPVKKGKITVTYSAQTENFKSVVLSQQELQLN